MNIEQAFENKIAETKGRSCAVLAERCEKSPEHPYGIKPADPINPDEIVVLVLPGTHSREDAIKLCNGMLKRVTNFVTNSPKLKEQKIRVVMPICSFGRYLDKQDAQNLILFQQNNPQAATRLLAPLTLIEKKELTSPFYVEDIYQDIFAPRITARQNPSQSLPQTFKRLNKVITVGYCWGAHTMLKLEDILQKKLQQAGYTEQETLYALSQMVAVNYSSDAPIGHTKTRTVSFSSASDLYTKHNNYAKEYLQMYMQVPDFGYLWLDSKYGNIFYCAQYNKNGVEGNPSKVVWRKINDAKDLFAAPTPTDEKRAIGEHDFLGFEPTEDMSKAAQMIQHFANNVIINSIKHALSQPSKGYRELPNTRRLAANSLKDHYRLTHAYFMGKSLLENIDRYGHEQIMKNSQGANIKFVELD